MPHLPHWLADTMGDDEHAFFYVCPQHASQYALETSDTCVGGCVCQVKGCNQETSLIHYLWDMRPEVIESRKPPMLTLRNGTIVIDGNQIVSHAPRSNCPACDTPTCCRNCDESVSDNGRTESDEELVARHTHNITLDVIESFVLALFQNGVITEADTTKVDDAIETVFDAIDNNS